jgi:DNA-directed RNA polymerase specialized sigma24 family protein
VRRTIRDEDIRNLEAAFDKLSDDYREALSLYRIVGLPIAERLGRTKGATKMLLSRALARLTSATTSVSPKHPPDSPTCPLRPDRASAAR